MTSIHVRRYANGSLRADSLLVPLRRDSETLTARNGVLVDWQGVPVPVRFTLEVFHSGNDTTALEFTEESRRLKKAMQRIEDRQSRGEIAYGGCHYGQIILTWSVEKSESGFFIHDPRGLAAHVTIAGLAPGDQAPYRIAEVEETLEPE